MLMPTAVPKAAKIFDFWVLTMLLSHQSGLEEAAMSAAKVLELEPRSEKSGMNPARIAPKSISPALRRVTTTAMKERTMMPTMTLMMRSKSLAPPPPAS